MRYWKIEPYENNDADYCVMSANTDEEHEAALCYAQDRLEGQWDGVEIGQKVSVTMKLCDDDNEKALKILKETNL